MFNLKLDKKYENLVLMLLIGLVFIIAGSFFFKGDGQKSSTKNQLNKETNNTYESELETKLRNILLKVNGVKDVSVMITLTSDSNSIVPAIDTNETKRTTQEKDTQGGTRTITEYQENKKTVTVNTTSGTQPVILSDNRPEIRGVLVVVKGINNSDDLYKLSNTIQVALGIPAYKVMVVSGK